MANLLPKVPLFGTIAFDLCILTLGSQSNSSLGSGRNDVFRRIPGTAPAKADCDPPGCGARRLFAFGGCNGSQTTGSRAQRWSLGWNVFYRAWHRICQGNSELRSRIRGEDRREPGINSGGLYHMALRPPRTGIHSRSGGRRRRTWCACGLRFRNPNTTRRPVSLRGRLPLTIEAARCRLSCGHLSYMEVANGA